MKKIIAAVIIVTAMTGCTRIEMNTAAPSFASDLQKQALSERKKQNSLDSAQAVAHSNMANTKAYEDMRGPGY